MADGLSGRRLRELLEEYGSVEALIEARPDLAGHIRSIQETIRGIRQAERPSLSAEDIVESQIAPFEIALDRHARRQMKAAAEAPRRKRRYMSQEIPQRKLFDVIQLLDADTPMTEVEEKTGIHRKLVAKIRDAAAGKRWQLGRGQTDGTVVLVKM